MNQNGPKYSQMHSHHALEPDMPELTNFSEEVALLARLLEIARKVVHCDPCDSCFLQGPIINILIEYILALMQTCVH